MRNIALTAVVALVLGVIILRQDQRISRVTDSVERLVNNIDRLIEEMHMSQPGQQYAEWWSAGSPPIKRSVTTTFQDEGHETETRSDWENRHNAAIYALKLQYPPI